MIDDSVRAQLDEELDPARVRSDAGIAHGAEYLAAHDVIAAANRIFGYDGWSFELLEVSPVHAANRNGEPTGVLYMARGRLTVGDATRVDVGTNDVSYRKADGDARPDAFETAIKGAVSDCLKRCLRTWGNQFGNSLYEKEQARRGGGGGVGGGGGGRGRGRGGRGRGRSGEEASAPAPSSNGRAATPDEIAAARNSITMCPEHEVTYDTQSPRTGALAHRQDDGWCVRPEYGRFAGATDPMHEFMRHATGQLKLSAAEILGIASVGRASDLAKLPGGLDAAWALLVRTQRQDPERVKTISDLVGYAQAHDIEQPELLSILGVSTLAEAARQHGSHDSLRDAVAQVSSVVTDRRKAAALVSDIDAIAGPVTDPG